MYSPGSGKRWTTTPSIVSEPLSTLVWVNSGRLTSTFLLYGPTFASTTISSSFTTP